MAQIVDCHAPKYLYRYRSLEKYVKEIKTLREGYVWCSNYKDKNDPMEGYYLANEFIEKHPSPDKLYNFIQYNKERIGLCSFAETGSNELMWAHYANQFRGIAIEFEVEKLCAFIRDATLARIRYVDELFEIQYTAGRLGESLKQVLSCKSSKWIYEQEWRLFSDIVGRVDYGERSCVSKVYIGARIDPDTRRHLETDLNDLGYRTQQMRLDGYAINWEPENP